MLDFSALQRRLRNLGVDPGPEDGIAGQKTADALRTDLQARYGSHLTVFALGARLVATFLPSGPDPDPEAGLVAGGRLFQGRESYEVTEIVIHCAATHRGWLSNQSLAAKVAEIRRWHRERGWRDIGYHWIIDTDGTVMAGRPETEIGAGVVGHNRGVIHICLIGGADSAATDLFRENYSPEQEQKLRELIADIRKRARIRRVSGHNEWAAKACPGFDVPTWLKAA